MSAPFSPGALTTLLQREESLRDEAALALKQAQDRLAYAESQMQMLHDYRDEYVARWQAEFGRAATPQILQCYHAFKGRLEEAISQQHDTLRQRESQVERTRAALVRAETRAAAVRKLIERRQAEWQRTEDRRARKLEDEFGRRSVWPGSQLDSLVAQD
ncbi:MAG: flagellar export protein FliJ [Pseudomonadota bacterium]|jgi:flagellar FliJ protein